MAATSSQSTLFSPSVSRNTPSHPENVPFADTAGLKAIAKDAGVGIGTLYRRFPTREILVEAVYRSESTRLCAAAPDLLVDRPPREALRIWMDRFVDYMATKQGMAEALHTVLVEGGDLRMETRDLLGEAVATLMAAGIASGSLRDDVDPNDLLMSLGGVALIAGHEQRRDLAGRLLDLLLDGLSPQGLTERVRAKRRVASR
jgi:AcrR family transcriptional regulator